MTTYLLFVPLITLVLFHNTFIEGWIICCTYNCINYFLFYVIVLTNDNINWSTSILVWHMIYLWTKHWWNLLFMRRINGKPIVVFMSLTPMYMITIIVWLPKYSTTNSLCIPSNSKIMNNCIINIVNSLTLITLH